MKMSVATKRVLWASGILACGLILGPLTVNQWNALLTRIESQRVVSFLRNEAQREARKGSYDLAMVLSSRAEGYAQGPLDAHLASARYRVKLIAWHPERLRAQDLGDASVDAVLVERYFPKDMSYARVVRAHVKRMKGLLGEARTDYQKVLEEDPKNGAAHLGLAMLYEQEPGKIGDAVREYRAAVEARPNDFELKERLGTALYRSGDAKGAVGVLGDVVANQESGRALGFLGMAELALGKNSDAIEHLRRSVRLLPNDVQVLKALGQALMLARKYGEAEAVLHRALVLKDDPAVRLQLASVLNSQKKYGQALQILQELQRAGVHDVGLEFELATALDGVGRVNEAVEAYKAVANEPLPPNREQARLLKQVQQEAARRLEALLNRQGTKTLTEEPR